VWEPTIAFDDTMSDLLDYWSGLVCSFWRRVFYSKAYKHKMPS
jgi:hypothetical protein